MEPTLTPYRKQNNLTVASNLFSSEIFKLFELIVLRTIIEFSSTVLPIFVARDASAILYYPRGVSSGLTYPHYNIV